MESLSSSSFAKHYFMHETVKSYFGPLAQILQFLLNADSTSKKKNKSHHAHTLAILASKVMAKAVCLNQGQYIQYSFLASERHRKIKDELNKLNYDLSLVSQHASDLVNFMNVGFYKNVQSNFDLLHAYFKNRSNIAPRICIKGNFKVGSSDRVITVFRDVEVGYNSNVEIGLNSGFAHIHNTGKYFLNNDLPAAALSGLYFNPRLNNDSVKEYAAKGILTQENWISCWTGANNKSEAYRSTLIIPMTLWNNEIDDDFKRRVRIKDVGRTIFGYLCIDHPEADYFTEEEDVRVGSVFADILSMYVFTRTINIEVSNTYKTAEDILIAAGKSLSNDKLSDINKFSNIHKHKDIHLSTVFKKSTENDLFSIDTNLLRFIGAENIIPKNMNTKPE